MVISFGKITEFLFYQSVVVCNLVNCDLETDPMVFLDAQEAKKHRTIARARTLAVLRALNGDRKGELIQFLYATQLIAGDEPIIDLSQADLSQVKGASLQQIQDANPAQIKSTCNWQLANFSEEFQQKLAQQPDKDIKRY
ncbi:MAG: hypothetical protein AAGE84_14305 [Cyanobacteria bacterium P01_G01_bin.39]